MKATIDQDQYGDHFLLKYHTTICKEIIRVVQIREGFSIKRIIIMREN